MHFLQPPIFIFGGEVFTYQMEQYLNNELSHVLLISWKEQWNKDKSTIIGTCFESLSQSISSQTSTNAFTL